MQPLKFIQSSDFHLECPPRGLAEVPDHLRELLIESPYRAANNVFDLALRHEVDFVLLVGDLLDPHAAGPRALLFLQQQFGRLAEREIQIFWLTGKAEQAFDWSDIVEWPSNVHCYPDHAPARFIAARHGQPIAEILAQRHTTDQQHANEPTSHALDFERSRGDLFTIGMLYGDLPAALLEHSEVDYWALGGEHDATLPVEATPVVHYSGSPQGRSPAELGPHSCTLVQVDQQGRVQTMPLSTEIVRFVNQQIAIDSSTSRADLEGQLRTALQALVDAPVNQSSPATTLMVTWTIAANTPGERLPLAQHAAELLGILRGEFGYRSPSVWSLRMNFETPTTYPAQWSDQETLLGDFLRAARHYELEDVTAPDLSIYLPQQHRAELLARIHVLNERPSLREAAWLGASLLSPEEANA